MASRRRRMSGGGGDGSQALAAVAVAAGVILLAKGSGGEGGGGIPGFNPSAGTPSLNIVPLGPVTGPDLRLNLNPSLYPSGLLVASCPVSNAGTSSGKVGGHIIVQERGLSGENFVVEGDWVKSTQGVIAPRLRTANLSTAIVASDPARRVIWVPAPWTLAPGSQSTLPFTLEIGALLLEGKSELDIVVIVRRLDTLAELKQVRFVNALDALRETGLFTPLITAAPLVEVNAF